MRLAWSETAANASLTSTSPRSDAARLAFFNAFSSASAGTVCSDANRSADMPNATISAIGLEPELAGTLLAHHHDRGGAVGDLRRVARP